MGRGLPGRYHGFRQWAEQGGGGRHGDDGAEPEGSEVDVETRLAALVQTVVSQEAGGQDITAQPSIVLWLTRRQRAGIIWSSTRRLQWCLSRSCQKLSKVVKSCQKLSKVVKSCCRNVGKLCTSHKIQKWSVFRLIWRHVRISGWLQGIFDVAKFLVGPVNSLLESHGWKIGMMTKKVEISLIYKIY